jgi:hypothetical protein
MRAKFSGLLFLCLLALSTQVSLANKSTEILVRSALSEKSSESSSAIAELRSLGPTGLEALFAANQSEIKRRIGNPKMASSSEWRRLTAALDAVSQQRDSYLAKLFWYTDLNEAKEAARASGKPILSLRLLGKLTDEFSCANSRFFRTVLYSNQEVAAELRQRFILHWQTVRAVPRVTIDFGNGRKLERTITGNSIHYILDSEGHPVDGLPGLYSPHEFLKGLTRAEKVVSDLEAKNHQERNSVLAMFHRSRLNEIAVDWFHDTKAIGGPIPAGLTVTQNESGEALAVMEIAVTKAITETSILRSMMAAPAALGRVTDEAAWKKIAALHSSTVNLDAASLGLIQKETHQLFANEKGTATPDARLRSLIEKLHATIALDTVRNEYLLHTKLHSWMSLAKNRENLDALNEKVYAELFLTPNSDPWLGLLSPETYTALENAGLR